MPSATNKRFHVSKVRPAMGRLFTVEDAVEGRANVALISPKGVFLFVPRHETTRSAWTSYLEIGCRFNCMRFAPVPAENTMRWINANLPFAALALSFFSNPALTQEAPNDAAGKPPLRRFTVSRTTSEITIDGPSSPSRPGKTPQSSICLTSGFREEMSNRPWRPNAC